MSFCFTFFFLSFWFLWVVCFLNSSFKSTSLPKRLLREGWGGAHGHSRNRQREGGGFLHGLVISGPGCWRGCFGAKLPELSHIILEGQVQPRHAVLFISVVRSFMHISFPLVHRELIFHTWLASCITLSSIFRPRSRAWFN